MVKHSKFETRPICMYIRMYDVNVLPLDVYGAVRSLTPPNGLIRLQYNICVHKTHCLRRILPMYKSRSQLVKSFNLERKAELFAIFYCIGR